MIRNTGVPCPELELLKTWLLAGGVIQLAVEPGTKPIQFVATAYPAAGGEVEAQDESLAELIRKVIKAPEQ